MQHETLLKSYYFSLVSWVGSRALIGHRGIHLQEYQKNIFKTWNAAGPIRSHITGHCLQMLALGKLRVLQEPQISRYFERVFRHFALCHHDSPVLSCSQQSWKISEIPCLISPLAPVGARYYRQSISLWSFIPQWRLEAGVWKSVRSVWMKTNLSSLSWFYLQCTQHRALGTWKLGRS